MKLFAPKSNFGKSTYISLSLIFLMTLSGCGTSQKMDSNTMLTCTMFTNPDEYRVAVLMDIAQGGRTVHKFIDTLVLDLKFDDETESKESLSIKNEFATALHTFADAYLSEDENRKKTASADLTKVGSTLRTRCESLGMDYSQIRND